MLRGLLLPLGLLSVFWSLTALPSFRRTTPAREVTARIIADERFKTGALNQMLTRIEAEPAPPIQQPELWLADVLIRLRTAEEAMQQKTLEEADREVEAAEHKLIAALHLSPTDSLLWLLLYSVETTRNGFDPKTLSYLDRSYLAGPHEGWIALRRNRLSLAVFPVLGDWTRQATVSEFSEMVDADFIEEAGTNLMGVGWAQRERLLAALRDVDVSSKTSLLKRLLADGINLKIPGIEHNERPWR
ncbi:MULTISPECIES: hypothetical protein [unclassified Bradyrhizobium]|uniref:hypothetical protein n=1 Tax=unclassified Bradyrhizobium TaxID=2631580 RepID=UPI001FF7E8E3|nr:MULTISPECIES: hypothetical protein [unclassified Bradyrhizobium]MCK1345781.1 hypothetical protein [Bradyrhizobium sp. CW11]MCK1587119.1 hypothetical protein [Bradyrhizobium sp. 169]